MNDLAMGMPGPDGADPLLAAYINAIRSNPIEVPPADLPGDLLGQGIPPLPDIIRNPVAEDNVISPRLVINQIPPVNPLAPLELNNEIEQIRQSIQERSSQL